MTDNTGNLEQTYSNSGWLDQQNGSLSEISLTLNERIKELNCLYGLSRIFENSNLTIEEILEGAILLIPPAWQYPEITCARIKIKNKVFATPDFSETEWLQSQNIIVNGKRFGTIEVYYKEQKPRSYEGPFLREERNLLYLVAQRLGHTIERKRAQTNVEFLYKREIELRKKLQGQIKARVDFTRKLIHELKTPLTALIATSQLLCDETKGQNIGKLANYILNSAESLNMRIDELHDVIRGESGILKLNSKNVDLKALLPSIMEETKALSRQIGMKIELHMKDDLPQVYGDSERIRQIILNLINNAIKYAREGKKIEITAQKTKEYVQIGITDFGPGIPAEKHKDIFEAGFQLISEEHLSGGFGIGLALCKTLVELQGGKIWMKSELGHGSSFYFTLPVVQEATADK